MISRVAPVLVLAAVVAFAAIPSIACAPRGGAASAASSPPVVAAPSAGRAYFVGGRVTGLRGVGLVLRTAAGDHAVVTADGDFAFGTPFDDGATYAIAVEREPISPLQSCVVERRQGRIAGRDATDIVVTCSTVSFDDIAPTAVAVNP